MSSNAPDVSVDQLIDFLKTATAREVLALRASPRLQERILELLRKSRTSGLSPEEEREWEQIELAEHLVRIAKAKAALKIKQG